MKTHSSQCKLTGCCCETSKVFGWTNFECFPFASSRLTLQLKQQVLVLIQEDQTENEIIVCLHIDKLDLFAILFELELSVLPVLVACLWRCDLVILVGLLQNELDALQDVRMLPDNFVDSQLTEVYSFLSC